MAVVTGTAKRIRPVVMTALTAFPVLLRFMLSTRTESDVMRRIAAPMAGSLATSFSLELLVYPAMFAIWKQRQLMPILHKRKEKRR